MFIDLGYRQDELEYLIAESYYYYGIYNSKADEIVIEAYFKKEDSELTPADEQRTVDAMYILEDLYSLSKQYSRQDIMNFLNDYLLSIGYDEEALGKL